MPEAATEFGKIKDHVHSIAHGMEQTHAASRQTADALGNILKTLLVVDITVKAIEKASAFSPMARSFKEALHTLGKTRDQLIANYDAEYEQIHKLLDEKRISRQEAEIEYDRIAAREPLLHSQLKLEQEMNRLSGIRLLVLSGVVGLMSRIFYLNHEFNEDLIKTNSNWKTRAQLFYENLQIQQETGVAFRSVTEAQKELINFGFQTRSNYHDVLTTVVQLREGLGMSVHEATQLAIVTERQVKVSFKDTADVVAGLVNSTSLAADEVGRLATNLARAMAVIKPGGIREFPQIVKLVGQYEDALKKFGGQVGQFEQLISRMTRPEGLMSAGVLGISDPEQLLKTAGVDQAIDRFYKYAVSQLAGAKGFDRMFRLDILAEQFGTTADQINAMIQAVEEAKKAQSGAITLQDRFRQQMQATGEGLKRITNSLMALAQGALYPVIIGVNWLTNFVANLLQTILKYKPLAIAAMVAIDISVVVAIIKLKNAAKAFWEVVVAAQVAAQSLKNYARTQLTQSALNNLSGGGALKQGELFAAGQLEQKLAPVLGRQFSTVAKDFGATLSKSWKPSFNMKDLLFGSRQAGQLELELGKESASTLAKRIGMQMGTEMRPLTGLFQNSLGKFSLQPLMAFLRSSLSGVGATIGRFFFSAASWLMRGISIALSPLGIIVAALGALTFVLVKTWQTQTKMLENQMQSNARLASMRDTYMSTAKTQIYMATRAGDKAKAEEVIGSVNRYLDRQASMGIITTREANIEKAKFSKQLETLVPLAQYTATQFGKLNMTPAERDAQTDDNLDFQQKIADNTKRAIEEARKNREQEVRQYEEEQRQRELRYMRRGGMIGSGGSIYSAGPL